MREGGRGIGGLVDGRTDGMDIWMWVRSSVYGSVREGIF